MDMESKLLLYAIGASIFTVLTPVVVALDR